MSKFKEAWIIPTSNGSGCNLAGGAYGLAEQVVLVDLVGSAETGADKVIKIDLGGQPISACAQEIAERVAQESPALVLVESNWDGQLIAASLAALEDAALFIDPQELGLVDAGMTSVRMVYGGSAFMKEIATRPIVAVVPPGDYEPVDPKQPASIEELSCSSSDIKLISEDLVESQKVDLSAERIVVGVGRGLGSADGVPMMRKFAQALDAGIGCTRPVGEEEGWFGDSGYLGISGDKIKPELYLACGISGQVQHMVGVSGAGMIFAINKDPNATIFKECDYGLIGDISTVIPRLTDLLSN